MPRPLSSPRSDELWQTLPRDRRAATLIIVYDTAGGPRVVLSVRAQTLRTYPGETALPGGRAEPGEDWWSTALREAHEETGFGFAALPPGWVARRAGALPAHLSRSYLFVRPCVVHVTRAEGAADAPEITLAQLAPAISAEEVSCVYSLPLAHFLAEASLDRTRTIKVPWAGQAWWFYSFPVAGADWLWAAGAPPPTFKGTLVTGLTAHILVDAARWWLDRDPEFEALSTLGYEDGVVHAVTEGRFSPRI